MESRAAYLLYTLLNHFESLRISWNATNSRQKIADHIGDVEDFGELPTSILSQLSLILSRRRVLNSNTIDFFLNPSYDTITLYDAASEFPLSL